jgi:hypothetical protein
VWTQDEIVRLLQYLELTIVAVAEITPERPDTFVVVARKRGPSGRSMGASLPRSCEQ